MRSIRRRLRDRRNLRIGRRLLEEFSRVDPSKIGTLVLDDYLKAIDALELRTDLEEKR